MLVDLDFNSQESLCGKSRQLLVLKSCLFVCSVYIQDQDINSFEIQRIKILGNKREWIDF